MNPKLFHIPTSNSLEMETHSTNNLNPELIKPSGKRHLPLKICLFLSFQIPQQMVPGKYGHMSLGALSMSSNHHPERSSMMEQGKIQATLRCKRKKIKI